ncbi:MAG: N-acetyltransferase [Bacteroidetes bacterium]|nr:N-acetyltransferase [Bacteroidota bacterium]
MDYFKHPLSQVDSENIGENSKIWQYVVVLKEAVIGKNTNICSHCFIENKVTIGDNVTVKAGVYLWDGIEVQDEVFIGPNVVFTNDVFPRSKNFKEPEKTIISKGASLGANSTILAGLTIGKYAMTGIGSVVTKDLKSHGLYYGNPAKQHGWIDEQGEKLVFDEIRKVWVGKDKQAYIEVETGLEKT